jgi:hypothetical protein
VECEDFFQILDHRRGERSVRVEVISLRLALHLLSLIHLGVTVAATQALQLAQDVFEAA